MSNDKSGAGSSSGIPEYYGMSKNDFGMREGTNYGLVGLGVGGVAGAFGGATWGSRLKAIENIAENTELSARSAGAVVFAGAAAVAIGIASTLVGYVKGRKEGRLAQEQHVKLYERLNRLEADKAAAGPSLA